MEPSEQKLELRLSGNFDPLRTLIHFVARTGLGLFFAATGIIKILSLQDFGDSVAEFGIVPDSLVIVAAFIVCATEIGVGIGLLLRVRGSLVAAVSLIALFILVLSYGIFLGLDIDCGCLGPNFKVSLDTQRVIDFGIVAWCVIIYLTSSNRNRSAVERQSTSQAKSES